MKLKKPRKFGLWAILVFIAFILFSFTACIKEKEKIPKQKVIVFAIDAGDWRIIDKLVSEGKLKNIKHIIDNGVSGPLESVVPIYTPPNMASLFTGKFPTKHGILSHFDTYEGDTRNQLYRNMKVKPLWEISRNKKVTIDLVGFQEFDYAPRIDGKVITGLYIIKKVSAHNNYFRYVNEEMVFMKYLPDLALKSGSILGDYSFLDDSSKIMSENNLSSKFNTVITRSMMPRILEGLKSTEERKKGNLEFSRIIKGIETIFQSNVSAKFIFEYDMLSKEIALDLYKKHDSDILFVYFAGTDVFGHNYYFDGWYLKDEEGQQEQIYRYYEVIDGYIGEFLSKRDEDTTFFIISDHGLQNLTMGQYLSALPHLPPHTKKGIFMAYGKNIKKEKIKDAQIVDITPTILYMYDQPIAEDFDGKVLLDIFDEEYTKNKVAKTIDTYEKQN